MIACPIPIPIRFKTFEPVKDLEAKTKTSALYSNSTVTVCLKGRGLSRDLITIHATPASPQCRQWFALRSFPLEPFLSWLASLSRVNLHVEMNARLCRHPGRQGGMQTENILGWRYTMAQTLLPEKYGRISFYNLFYCSFLSGVNKYCQVRCGSCPPLTCFMHTV